MISSLRQLLGLRRQPRGLVQRHHLVHGHRTTRRTKTSTSHILAPAMTMTTTTMTTAITAATFIKGNGNSAHGLSANCTRLCRSTLTSSRLRSVDYPITRCRRTASSTRFWTMARIIGWRIRMVNQSSSPWMSRIRATRLTRARILLERRGKIEIGERWRVGVIVSGLADNSIVCCGGGEP